MNPFLRDREEWAAMLEEQQAISDTRDEWRVKLTDRCIVDGVRAGLEVMGFEPCDDETLAARFEIVRDASIPDRVRVAVRESDSSDAERGAVFTVTVAEADGQLEATLGPVVLIRDLLEKARGV